MRQCTRACINKYSSSRTWCNRRRRIWWPEVRGSLRWNTKGLLFNYIGVQIKKIYGVIYSMRSI